MNTGTTTNNNNNNNNDNNNKDNKEFEHTKLDSDEEREIKAAAQNQTPIDLLTDENEIK